MEIRTEPASIETTTHGDALADAWFESYVEPSTELPRRRRRRHRRNRGPRRPQPQRRDTLMAIASFVLVGVMTACFYVVLTR